MKKYFILLTPIFLFLGLSINISGVHAQGMMQRAVTPTVDASNSTTAQDELAGKAIFDKLQSKVTTCSELTDDDFDVLGDYYMGQQLGSTAAHEVMNNRMVSMMGEAQEKQMHIFLGKRLSGCDTNFAVPTNGSTYLPMMGFGNMMNGSWGNNYQPGFTSMMGFNSTSPIYSQIIWLLASVFLILGIIYFWKGINKKK